VWREVQKQIHDHLSSHNITAGSRPNRDLEDYFDSAIFLIRPYGRRQITRRAFIQSDLTVATFTVKTLTKISQQVNNPELDAQHPLLFFGKSTFFIMRQSLTQGLYLAPRHQNLWGPITAGGAVHRCFPWKVWRNLQEISSSDVNRDAQCVAGCPNQEIVRWIMFPMSLCTNSFLATGQVDDHLELLSSVRLQTILYDHP
jgi:hypothetical protein